VAQEVIVSENDYTLTKSQVSMVVVALLFSENRFRAKENIECWWPAICCRGAQCRSAERPKQSDPISNGSTQWLLRISQGSRATCTAEPLGCRCRTQGLPSGLARLGSRSEGIMCPICLLSIHFLKSPPPPTMQSQSPY